MAGLIVGYTKSMTNLPEPISPTHPIYAALIEIQKPRSRFQMEKFVVGQHDTPEQQYKQTLLEIQSLIYTIKVSKLELKKSQITIDRLRATGDPIDEIDAQIKEIGLEQTNLVMVGAERELKDLVEIWESFEHKYTYEELEDLQPEYWKARLTRQAQLEAIGSGGKVGWASLDSLRQINHLDLEQVDLDEPKEIPNGDS